MPTRAKKKVVAKAPAKPKASAKPNAAAKPKAVAKPKARPAYVDDATIAKLVDRLESATKSLRGVARKRLFGCEGYFAGGETIFALVWKAGTIGLKLPEPASFEAAMALPGSQPWIPGAGRGMPHYVLLADAVSADAKLLAKWTRTAHDLAAARAAVPAGRRK